MNNTKKIILLTSIAAVLGFGILAFQTNNISVDALMNNTSKILDIGEKSEITTLAKPEGKGGKPGGGEKESSLEGELLDASGYNKINCSASNLFSCSIKNSGGGLDKVVLDTSDGIPCKIKDVKNGASRASIDTRKSQSGCDYQPLLTYKLTVFLNSNPLGESVVFMVSTSDNSLVILEKIVG
jgi:hypothetical protein